MSPLRNPWRIPAVSVGLGALVSLGLAAWLFASGLSQGGSAAIGGALPPAVAGVAAAVVARRLWRRPPPER